MNRSEIAVLRTKLRALNIEYSALVRGRGEGTRVRMERLRAERRALMALMAQQRLEGGREHHTAVASVAGAVSSPNSEMTAVYPPSATVASAASPIEAPPTT